MLTLLKFQPFKEKCKTTEKVFLLVLTVSLLLLTYRFFTLPQITFLDIANYLIILCIFLLLSYLAYFDFKKMEVHNTISLFLMIFLLLLNIVLYIWGDRDNGIPISENYSYIPYLNFFSALTIGSVFQLVVIVSKEKALGLGDVRIGIIIGLLIGYDNLLLWLQITVFTALIYGLYIASKKGKIKGIRIPFVPFMVLGCIGSILLGI
jgi:leader peptidase (prepilin peptidase)/N-methyltransferase